MARKKSHQKSKSNRPVNDRTKVSVLTSGKETKPKVSFWQRLLRALPLMALALLFTFIFNRAGLFTELETTFLDVQMRTNAPAEESDVVIVDITEKDFEDKDTFRGQTSPLNPAALQTLLEAIAEGQPCVIGVDVNTSFEQFKDFKVSDKLSNVVWVRSYNDVNRKIIPLNVLGGQDLSLNEKSGLTVLNSEKGVTRTYSRLVETTVGDLPSFAWAIFKEGKSRNCENLKFPDLEETTEPLLIDYSRGAEGMEGGGRTKITAASARKFAETRWKGNNLIRNKIVMLGGSYSVEDRHETPLGEMQGYNVIVNIIETELGGGGIKQPSLFSKILLQIFDGILLIALFQLFTWRKAVLLSLPFIIFLSLVCSFLTYYSFSHWVFFAPVMIGVVLTELFDRTKDHFKKHYKREITETYKELGGHPDEKPNHGTED